MFTVQEPAVFHETVVANKTLTMPAGTVSDAEVKAGANIAASKLIVQSHLQYAQKDGTAVVADTEMLHCLRGAGLIVAVEAATGLAATGGDRTVTVDIQKSTGGGAFASVLSASPQFTSADLPRVVKAGTLSVTALVDNDILRCVITVAGAAGNQAQGLVVTVTLNQNPTS